MLFYSTSQWLFCLIRQNCFKVLMEEKCAKITKVFEQRGMTNKAELILPDALISNPWHKDHIVAQEQNARTQCSSPLGQGLFH